MILITFIDQIRPTRRSRVQITDIPLWYVITYFESDSDRWRFHLKRMGRACFLNFLASGLGKVGDIFEEWRAIKTIRTQHGQKWQRPVALAIDSFRFRAHFEASGRAKHLSIPFECYKYALPNSNFALFSILVSFSSSSSLFFLQIFLSLCVSSISGKSHYELFEFRFGSRIRTRVDPLKLTVFGAPDWKFVILWKFIRIFRSLFWMWITLFCL